MQVSKDVLWRYSQAKFPFARGSLCDEYLSSNKETKEMWLAIADQNPVQTVLSAELCEFSKSYSKVKQDFVLRRTPSADEFHAS